MNRFINFYLKVLPVLGLVGIVFSAIRTAMESTITVYLLIFSAILDASVVVYGRKYLNKPIIYFVFLLMLLSVFVGLFNDVELSRRYITDVTNPLFFFCKILIFKEYWKVGDFEKYVSFYKKVAIWGSLLLLPVAYFIYSSAGVNRIAIFPPLELPFAAYLQGNPLILILILILILLYGKRAQLVGAFLTFFSYIFIFQKRKMYKYFAIGFIGIIALIMLFEQFSDNNAIRRLTYTYEQIIEAPTLAEGLSSVSAGRDDEITSVFALMEDDLDYFFGLGVGFTYDLNFYSDKDVSNVHFSPLGFLSKYGIIFTLFIYLYLFKVLFSLKKKYIDKDYIIAYALFTFIFIESFFSYSLFVTPLAAVVIGYLKCQIHSNKVYE